MPPTTTAPAAVVSRRFPSVCDVCLRELEGEVVREGRLVYHRRRCPEHGERRLLMSRNGERYARLDAAYHRLFPADAPVPSAVDACFFITHRCNQDCTYCAMEAGRYPYFEDMELAAFRADVQQHRGSKVSLIGGEPCEHPRFFEFVETVARADKTLLLFTNGLRLADDAVVDRLVTTAPKLEIRMTFEGFGEADYAHLPGRTVRARKLRALANLERRGVPTVLGHTILAEDDPDAEGRTVRAIVEFALARRFVRGLTFQSAVALGGSRDLPADRMLSVDGVIDRVVAALPVPVAREVAYPTQKLLLVLARLFDLPMCAYVQAVPLVRSGGGWVSLDHFFDLERLDRALDEVIADLPSTPAGIVAAVARAGLRAVRVRRAPSLAVLAREVLPLFLRQYDFGSIPPSVLPLVSISVCDRHNLDQTVARRCEKDVRSSRAGAVRRELCSAMVIRHLRERVAADAGRDEP
jgi:pyruvate-formate lyase-activating enzyme